MQGKLPPFGLQVRPERLIPTSAHWEARHRRWWNWHNVLEFRDVLGTLRPTTVQRIELHEKGDVFEKVFVPAVHLQCSTRD